MKAEDLKPNKILRGPLFPEPVQVIVTIPMGAAIKLIGKGQNTKTVYEPILTAEQLALLETTPDTEPFDGDSQMFRLPYGRCVMTRTNPPPDPQQCWREFRAALDRALRSVNKHYFRVRRHEAPEAWRERAYCYELYHQLRRRLRRGFPYTLHGEIDKRGHRTLLREFGTKRPPNPDFVLHVPGAPDNLAVIEVKTSDTKRGPVRTDLIKLRRFMKKLGYRYGLMLLFGDTPPVRLRGYKDIEILWHPGVGRRPMYHAGLRQTAPQPIRVNLSPSVVK